MNTPERSTSDGWDVSSRVGDFNLGGCKEWEEKNGRDEQRRGRSSAMSARTMYPISSSQKRERGGGLGSSFEGEGEGKARRQGKRKMGKKTKAKRPHSPTKPCAQGLAPRGGCA